jgi:hypothetical protein
MMQDPNSSRVRWAAVSLALSGVFFLLFPVTRPFFDETSMQGAAEFASIRWPIAHSFGIVGFILMALGFLGVNIMLTRTAAEQRSFKAMIFYWVGAGLTLPFFGAEAFGLQVIGQAAVDQDSTSLLPLVSQIRFGPGIVFVITGLILIALATIILASAVWKSGVLSKWSGIPLAVGFVVYIPLLQGAPVFQPIRIVDGFLIAAGAIWIAWTMGRRSGQR